MVGRNYKRFGGEGKPNSVFVKIQISVIYTLTGFHSFHAIGIKRNRLTVKSLPAEKSELG